MGKKVQTDASTSEYVGEASVRFVSEVDTLCEEVMNSNLQSTTKFKLIALLRCGCQPIYPPIAYPPTAYPPCPSSPMYRPVPPVEITCGG